jgi:hypothetical protein
MSYSPNFVGANAKGSSRSLQTSYQNGEAYSLTQGMPVCVNTVGNMVHVDVTSDANVAGIVGVVAPVSVVTGAVGEVMDIGRLENFTTSFSCGDAIYINTDGTLMNVRPDIGVQYGTATAFAEGDYVVFVGVIVQNQYNTQLLDLKVYMDVVGQL